MEEAYVKHYYGIFKDTDFDNLDKELEEIGLTQWEVEGMIQPRLSTWMGVIDDDVGLDIVGRKMKQTDVKEREFFKEVSWTKEMDKIRKKTEKITKLKFNSALIHKYRDGEDNFLWHSDSGYPVGPAVISVSFGADRHLSLMKYDKNNQKLVGDMSVHNLSHGDLFIMYNIQGGYKHCLQRSKTKAPRISVTFRNLDIKDNKDKKSIFSTNLLKENLSASKS